MYLMELTHINQGTYDSPVPSSEPEANNCGSVGLNMTDHTRLPCS